MYTLVLDRAFNKNAEWQEATILAQDGAPKAVRVKAVTQKNCLLITVDISETSTSTAAERKNKRYKWNKAIGARVEIPKDLRDDLKLTLEKLPQTELAELLEISAATLMRIVHGELTAMDAAWLVHARKVMGHAD